MLLLIPSTSESISKTALIDSTSYVGFDFIVNDQPIVDDQVMVQVNVHHPGFVSVYNSSNYLLGYSSTTVEVVSHNHSQISLKVTSGSDEGMDHTAFVRIALSLTSRTTIMHARLYNDTNMNMQFDQDGTDVILKDEADKEAAEQFSVTESYPTTIVVSDQEVNLTNSQVYVEQVIVPGPAWLVIHINDSGLGAMVGRRYIPLKQGVNTDLYVDINAYILLQEEGDKLPSELAVFAHLHWDNKEYGIFNKTTDTHLFSPAFDDPIIGNESAKPFTITFKDKQTASGYEFPLISISLSFLAMVTLFTRKRNS